MPTAGAQSEPMSGLDSASDTQDASQDSDTTLAYFEWDSHGSFGGELQLARPQQTRRSPADSSEESSSSTSDDTISWHVQRAAESRGPSAEHGRHSFHKWAPRGAKTPTGNQLYRLKSWVSAHDFGNGYERPPPANWSPRANHYSCELLIKANVIERVRAIRCNWRGISVIVKLRACGLDCVPLEHFYYWRYDRAAEALVEFYQRADAWSRSQWYTRMLYEAALGLLSNLPAPARPAPGGVAAKLDLKPEPKPKLANLSPRLIGLAGASSRGRPESFRGPLARKVGPTRK